VAGPFAARTFFNIGAVKIDQSHVLAPAKSEKSPRIATPILARYSVESLKEKYGGYKNLVRLALVVPAQGEAVAVEGQR
jgi:hypothetical protein